MKGFPNPQLLQPLPGAGPDINYLSLAKIEACGLANLSGLPRSLRVLAEGILQRVPVEKAKMQIAALCKNAPSASISFFPGRALLQDFMGIPLMTDMASMRDALAARGGDPKALNPVIPVDFVVDHSLTVLQAGTGNALEYNRRLEMERNRERFAFIKWCQNSFDNFRVIPPGRGIMHQVNLEWLTHIVTLMPMANGQSLAHADTMIGTDSHTTMVNALGVLGWGVGGIEAEMAMLGAPLEMSRPPVIGMRLKGSLRPGVTATDLVLHMTERMRQIGVVGAFTEFHGAGVSRLPVADRATIANMAPEFGATCAYFPIDDATIDYLRMTGRPQKLLDLVEAYAKAQGLWQSEEETTMLAFDQDYEFDLVDVEPSMAGPTRPEDRVALSDVPASFGKRMEQLGVRPQSVPFDADGLGHGAVVIAAIASCTNTSNPAVMMAAGLLARNAVSRGLRSQPWVKTSLSPGSRVVTDYLTAAGLTPSLETLGFHNIGYGCATCNGNSGPLADSIRRTIDENALCTVAVLSGNRNFEGRIHPQVKAAYLASPPLVIASAIAGRIDIDLENDPLGHDPAGIPVFLRDIWPDDREIADAVTRHVTGDLFARSYGKRMETTPAWAELASHDDVLFPWDKDSSFINPSPFPGLGPSINFSGTLSGVRPLLVLGDAITTDHISPNGAINPESPAGLYLRESGLEAGKLGNFGARRGDASVCSRGMFDNPLLANELLGGELGNATLVFPGRERKSVYEAASIYKQSGEHSLIIAGRNYGAGSSRDWAAKGLRTLGVVAVIAESFERIHRSNLVGMGVLPLRFPTNMTRRDLEITGAETFAFEFPDGGLYPEALIRIVMEAEDGRRHEFDAHLEAFSEAEVHMIVSGGVLPLILSGLRDTHKFENP